MVHSSEKTAVTGWAALRAKNVRSWLSISGDLAPVSIMRQASAFTVDPGKSSVR